MPAHSQFASCDHWPRTITLKSSSFCLNDSVYLLATRVQMAYECFSGTRECGSGDMIPMDELSRGKSQST